MPTASPPLRILLAVAPQQRAAAEARVHAAALDVELLAHIAVDQAPPDVIVVGAQGWHATLSQLRASFPFATRVVLANVDGPDLDRALIDGVHDVIAVDESPRALARSLRLGAYRAQMEVRFSEIRKRYRSAVQSGGVGVLRWDLRDRSMVFDPSWKAMLGYADAGHGDTSVAWFSRVHPADQADLRRVLRSILDGGAQVAALDYRLQHRDGSWLWVRLRLEVKKIATDHFVLVGQQEDVTVEKISAQRVAWADRHDSLTGLLGRSAFIDAVEDRLVTTAGSAGVLGVLDVDRLKYINTTYGRRAGDEVLLWLAGLCEDRLAGCGIVARLTAHKFSLLVELESLIEAESLGRELLRELCAEVFLADDGAEFGVTARISLAEQPRGADDARDWLSVADAGLVEATSGRGCVYVVRRARRVSGFDLHGDDLSTTTVVEP